MYRFIKSKQLSISAIFDYIADWIDCVAHTLLQGRLSYTGLSSQVNNSSRDAHQQLTPNIQAFIVDSSAARRNGYMDPLAGSHAPRRHLRVMMLGLRGFPNVQGGVESHVEHLAPLLVHQGCQLEVIVRSPYQKKETGKEWRGVKFISIWAPKTKAFEAIMHTFFGVLYAAIKRPDVLHIQAIGPALMTPLARLLGLNVVVTHHGPDYDRQKWGILAKTILKAGEWAGMRYANGRIVISNVIRELVERKHEVASEIIHNGVVVPELGVSESYLESFGLKRDRYILLVSRLVPEKRHLDLIEAFTQANVPGYKLVFVGSSDHPDAYVTQLLEAAASNPSIVLTGFQKGEVLRSLYTHAGLFVLPSSHEGLSISLLEALSYGLPVLASDIPANLEVKLHSSCYFKMGDVQELAEKIRYQIQHPASQQDRMDVRAWIDAEYNWSRIAEMTYAEYRKAFY